MSLPVNKKEDAPHNSSHYGKIEYWEKRYQTYISVVHFWNLIATCTFLVLAIQSHSIGIRTTMELRTLSLNTLINQRASSTLGVALPVDIFLDLKFI